MSKSQIAEIIQRRVEFLGMGPSAFLSTTGLNLFNLTDLITGEESEITIDQLQEVLETLNLLPNPDGVDAAGPWRKHYIAEEQPGPTIGEMIRRRRGALNLSQSEVARRLGVSSALIGQWEAGKSRIMADDIPKIAAVLRTTSARLMGELPTDGEDAYVTLKRMLGNLSDRMSMEQLGDLCVAAIEILQRS